MSCRKRYTPGVSQIFRSDCWYGYQFRGIQTGVLKMWKFMDCPTSANKGSKLSSFLNYQCRWREIKRHSKQLKLSSVTCHDSHYQPRRIHHLRVWQLELFHYSQKFLLASPCSGFPCVAAIFFTCHCWCIIYGCWLTTHKFLRHNSFHHVLKPLYGSAA